ncbi:hypothetical protein [Chitinophaga sp. S165]|uniref:hypothetical protein n=1 Tax=Chitinophaga sp. S165 TaxID=2135462 RepID=UPI000D70C975|nr:hypothetical protein [Chitinophaga sp. S165]PWV45383.1 hypothetical protein C7475_11446 [Chitinophaga sp. S165]
MPHELKESLPLNLIGTVDYQAFISMWLCALNDNNGENDLSNYFKKNCEPTTAILFNLDAIKYLVSSEGVVAIKAKFCIDNRDKASPTFNIILFGVDNNGRATSAYYLGTPTTNSYSTLAEIQEFPHSTIPSALAASWIKNWLHNKTYIVNEKFSTVYGYLEGYTFEMMDFLDAVFDEPLKSNALCVHLALHEFYKPGIADINDKTFTFGLVLQGIENPENKFTPFNSDNLYYDISAPSPPY